MFPPHLPPPSSSLARHRQIERLKIIAAAAIFGLLGGLSGGAVMVGWIWPLTVGDEGVFFGRGSVTAPREQLQAKARLKISDEVFTVYRAVTTAGKVNYFSESDRVGEGVSAVTSGWVLMYQPNYDGRSKDWVVVAENGSLFSVSKYLFDKRTGLLYLKVAPKLSGNGSDDQQLKVVTFNSSLSQYDEVFILQDGRWHSSMINGFAPAGDSSHLDTASPYLYAIADSFKKGSVVIDASGNMVGFTSGDNVVMSLVNENYFLNGIDEKKQLTYPSLGVEGWYSDEKLLIINEEKISGFIVAKVLGNRQFFQKGDIILEVNGRAATRENLWYNPGTRVRVSVWRGGQIIENQVQYLEF